MGLEKINNWIKKHPVWTGMIALVFLMFLIGSSPSDDSSNAQPIQDIETNTLDNSSNSQQDVENNTLEVEEQVLSTEDKIKKDVALILGESNRDVEIIREISVIERGEDNLSVTVMYNANDNLRNSWIKRGILMDSEEILEKLYTDYPNVGSVEINGYFPLTDKYGNSKDVIVVIVKMDKETEDKINWYNFIVDNLLGVADIYYAHPVLND